jgi:hypothetical protein
MGIDIGSGFISNATIGQPITHIELLEATCCSQSVEPDLADGVHG